VNDLLTKVTANVYTQMYAFFVDQAANVLYAAFAAVPVVWAIAFERTGSLKARLPDGCSGQHRFAFMGLLDALGTFFSSIGGPGTPGHLQVVLNQTLILFTMVAARVWLGTRHDTREVACACVIFGGALVAASGSTAAADDGSGGAQAWSVVMFTLSNVPMALSNVYKELGFADKSLRLDVWSMTCITTLYQTLATFLLLPLQMLPYTSGDPDRGLSLAECWSSFVGGQACFFGHSSEGIDCSIAGPLLTLYVLANLSLNCLSLCLTKLGSATGVGSVLCSLAYALKLPFSNLLFAQRWLMGSQVEKLSSCSLVGLVIVVGGFLGYLYYSGPGKGDAEEALLPAEHAEPSAVPKEYKEEPALGASAAYDSPPRGSTRMEIPSESATMYVRLPRDDVGGIAESPLARSLVDSTRTIPDDTEPWAFHDRLVGCDSSNSARLVSSRILKRGLVQLMCGEAQGGPTEEELD